MSHRAVHEAAIVAGNGVELHSRAIGRGPRSIVVLHGGPGFSMEYLADDLAPLGDRHRLIFYDQRGAGRSTLVRDREALDAQRFVDDLEAVRRHFGIEQLTLLGHSWGAAIAALYALREPARVAALLLVGAIPLRRDALVGTFERLAADRSPEARARLAERRKAWLADPGDAAACRAYYEAWFEPFYADGSAARNSKGDFCAGPAAALRNKVDSVDRWAMDSLGDYDWRAALAAVPARSLIVHGSDDVIAVDDAREWAAALPNARLLLFERAGHFPYVEQPARFFAAIETFVDGCWPDGAVAVEAGSA
jgi:proline iminopeptidase